MTDRRRNIFILLVVLGLLIASLAVIATKPTRLGLDLQGGVELVYEGKPTPQQPEVTQEAIDRAVDIMRERVDQLGVSEPEIQRFGATQISVGLPDVDNAERAQRQVGQVAQLYFYDWEINVIGPDGKPDPTNKSVTDVPIPTLYEAVKRASQRPPKIDGNNTANEQWYLFYKGSKKRVGPDDAQPAESRADLLEDFNGRQPPGTEILKVNPGTVVVQAEKADNAPANAPPRYFVLDDDPELTGTNLRNPEQQFDQGPGGSGQPIVTFEFTDRGREQFQKVTRRVAQRGQQQAIPGAPPQQNFQHFAAVLDNRVITRPFISYVENPDGIDGRNGAQISGGFTISSAQDLARLLETGALPVKLELISQSQVSATLGREALNQGLAAAIAGFAIVVLFLLLFYRVLGVIAAIGLAIYGIYFYALIKLIPITLTLPGIAGLILTLGVCADANIVIFERVKEEIRAGRSVAAGIAAGYRKGLSAIIDANVVTIMTAFILFILATSGVKGFAFTLGVGTIVSLFTAVLATSAILGTMSRSRLLQRPSALGAGKQRVRFRYDFMGYSKWFFSASGIILLVGALSIGGKGLTFGIDFEGGARIRAQVDRPADEEQLRSILAANGAEDAEIQRVNDPDAEGQVFQISTDDLQGGETSAVETDIESRFGGESTGTFIGPTFGETVANTAIVAIIASLLVISAYIALRFQWKYAVPVLIAVMHDILITSGVYSLTGREVTTSTVAALLTVLGFSLYDTIIVFDRIRENVPRMPRAAFSQIVNRSMSEVIARSLATSFCSGLPVLALLLFGGETLKDFAFALLVGTISGTYSSVFIAGPVLTLWKEREEVYQRRIARIKKENNGVVPAYATASRGGEPVDVEPEKPRRRGLRRGPLAPDQPGEEVSAEEFEEMKRDIQPEVEELSGGGTAATAAATKPARRRAPRAAAPEPEPEPPTPAPDGEPGGSGEVTAAPDATPEEVEAAAAKPKPQRKGRNRKHGRRR